MWSTIGLTAFIVADVCAAERAYPPEHGPYASGEVPEAVRLHQCRRVAPPNLEAGDPIDYDVTHAPTTGGTAQPQIRIQRRVGRDECAILVSIRGPGGEMLVEPLMVSDWPGMGEPLHADLNADGRADFVLNVWSMGCGLGAENCEVVLALSEGTGYRVWNIPAMDAGEQDFIRLPGEARCGMVRTAFIYGEPGKDGKTHNYWVHHLLAIDGAELHEYKADPRFPKWIMYTYRPNHRATTQLTAEQKDRLWRESGEALAQCLFPAASSARVAGPFSSNPVVPSPTTRPGGARGASSTSQDACSARQQQPSSAQRSHRMKRYGMVIKVRPEKLEEYKRLHAAVWPDVLKMIHECNIRNYSIYHKDGSLFSYFEYVGDDFEADMARMAADPTTQKWWECCTPCQEPLATRAEGEWWANMEEVFHCE